MPWMAEHMWHYATFVESRREVKHIACWCGLAATCRIRTRISSLAPLNPLHCLGCFCSRLSYWSVEIHTPVGHLGFEYNANVRRVHVGATTRLLHRISPKRGRSSSSACKRGSSSCVWCCYGWGATPVFISAFLPFGRVPLHQPQN